MGDRDLSARLGLNQDEGEKWIVNLIRDTRMDGKLDYKEGTVLMNHPANSVYQQVCIPCLLRVGDDRCLWSLDRLLNVQKEASSAHPCLGMPRRLLSYAVAC